MSEQNAEATETGAEGTEQQSQQQPESQDLPSDHPLVKTLAAQKAAIKELKSKASRLDELEESQKSEAEKAADRISKAEAEAASVPAKVSDALKAHLVALHNIDADDAELFLTATDPEVLLKQVTRLVESTGKRQKKNHVPREGANPNSGPETDEREFVRGLFGGE